MSNDDFQTARVTLADGRHPVRIILSGSIGAYHSDELYFACLTAVERGSDVDVDCRDVSHLGGSTLQMLLGVDRAIGDTGHRLRLVDTPDAIRAQLGDAGLTALVGGA